MKQQVLAALETFFQQGQNHFAQQREEQLVIRDFVAEVRRAFESHSLHDIRVLIGYIGGGLKAPEYTLDTLANWSVPSTEDDLSKGLRNAKDEPWVFVATTLPGPFWLEIIRERGKPLATVHLVGETWYKRYARQEP